ncbi:MAG: hypothetical protein FD153_1964 [Rhodospirillaceae bacterium]|nr:MAG: hypothetical protein FD153_1964 [Rhodospirillaceae bacterium]
MMVVGFILLGGVDSVRAMFSGAESESAEGGASAATGIIAIYDLPERVIYLYENNKQYKSKDLNLL